MRYFILIIFAVFCIGQTTGTPPGLGRGDIISYKYEGRNVRYLYNSKIPVTALKNEDISKRTGNAQFLKPNKKGEITARFYSGQPFFKSGRNWYQTETAVTTREIFDDLIRPSIVERWLGIDSAVAATYYSGAGDGHVNKSQNGAHNQANWDTAHDANTGSAVNYIGSTMIIRAIWYSAGGGWYLINRAFFPFDTAWLPDNAVISAATFSVYCVPSGAPAWGIEASLVQTTQASPTALTTADYDQCGDIDDPVQGAPQVAIWKGDKRFTFTLNSIGIGWINKIGWTKLGLRESNYDVPDVMTPLASESVTLYTSEQGGTTYDPYLTVTYTSAYIPRVTIF